MGARYTYITMINTDSYLNGALCLFESLRKVKAKYPFLNFNYFGGIKTSGVYIKGTGY